MWHVIHSYEHVNSLWLVVLSSVWEILLNVSCIVLEKRFKCWVQRHVKFSVILTLRMRSLRWLSRSAVRSELCRCGLRSCHAAKLADVWQSVHCDMLALQPVYCGTTNSVLSVRNRVACLILFNVFMVIGSVRGLSAFGTYALLFVDRPKLLPSTSIPIHVEPASVYAVYLYICVWIDER
jgi:hypothetical protein